MKKLAVILSTVLLTSCAAVDPVGFATSVASNVTSTAVYQKIFAEEKKPEPPKVVQAPKPVTPPAPAPVSSEPEAIVKEAVAEVNKIEAKVVSTVVEVATPVVKAVKETTDGLAWYWYALIGLIGLIVLRKFKKK